MPNDALSEYPIGFSETAARDVKAPDMGPTSDVLTDVIAHVDAPPKAVVPIAGVTVLGLRRDVEYSSISAASLVVTADGARPAGELVTGDLVQTLDNGLQPLLWVSDHSAPDATGPNDPTPIRIAADALGNNIPARPVVVAPDQSVLIECSQCEALLGHREHLVAARDLVHLKGVEPTSVPDQPMVYLMCAAHEILNIGGIWVDSFRPVEARLNGLSPQQRDDLIAENPRLRFAAGSAAYVEARPSLNAAEAMALL